MVLMRSFIIKQGTQQIGHKIHRKPHIAMGGSILLQKGGSGVGSSYSSLENRIETIGSGLKHLVNLRNLEMRPPSLGTSKPKNISF